MIRGPNVGRTAFVVATAAGVAGLLDYSPPPTELQAAAPAPRSIPTVSGPFTATPASVPLPVEAAVATTRPPATAVAPAPATTEAPPPVAVAEADGAAPAAAPAYAPAPVDDSYQPAEPDPEASDDDSGHQCAHFDNLLTVLDDSELRAAVATIGCT